MKYLVIDRDSNQVIARFAYERHAFDYMKWLNEKLNQLDRHIVVVER